MFENEFKGKVVLVTGGSRGIGFAAVKGFLAAGAKVYFLSHYEETGAKALAALKEINPDYEVMTKAIDLCDYKAVQVLYKEIIAKWGRLDVLVNNAGTDNSTWLTKLKQSEWDAVCNLNMKGPYTMMMNTKASFWVLVISYIWRNLGYDIVLWLAGLSTIPTALYEAAKVDGAGTWKCFTRITCPNLLPSLFTIVVLSLLNGFKVFREAYLVAGDYPQENMYLLQHLFNNWYRDLAMDKMAAAAVVTGITIMVLVLLLQKAWERED